jgi:hypothetical protein
MIAELENIMTLTENRALVTEQATQNESDPALGVRRPEIPVPLHCLPEMPQFLSRTNMSSRLG